MKPCTVHRGLSKDGELLFFCPDVPELEQHTKQAMAMIDESKPITFSTGLVDRLGQPIYTGDYLVRASNGLKYIVQKKKHIDDNCERPFFITCFYIEDDGSEHVIEHRILDDDNAKLYIVVDNIYHTFEREE